MKSSLDSHSKCSGVECARNSIDPYDYRMSHDLGLCEGSCSMVKPSLEGVIDILKNQEISIPIMQIVDENSFIDLCTSSRPMEIRSKKDYIAISHVWVDGLGSTTNVGLPECKARRLLRLIRKVAQDANPSIWIDALCIPEAKEEPLNLRSTKRPIGELAAVAELVQLSTTVLGKILGEKDQTNCMRIFLKAVRWLSYTILSLPCPKLGTATFRWAPCTFMNKSELRLSRAPKNHTAECGEYGLKGEWLVLS